MTILEEIAALVKKADAALNAQTDAAMAKIAEAESALQAAGVHVVCPARCRAGYGSIRYCRLKGRWRVYLCRGDGDYVPWQECNREEKIEIAKSIPALLTAIRDELRRAAE